MKSFTNPCLVVIGSQINSKMTKWSMQIIARFRRELLKLSLILGMCMQYYIQSVRSSQPSNGQGSYFYHCLVGKMRV